MDDTTREAVALMYEYKLLLPWDSQRYNLTYRGLRLVEELLDQPEFREVYTRMIHDDIPAPLARLTVLLGALRTAVETRTLPPLLQDGVETP